MYITKVDINTNRGEEYGRESTLTKSQFTKHNSCEGYDLYIIFAIKDFFSFHMAREGSTRVIINRWILLFPTLNLKVVSA